MRSMSETTPALSLRVIAPSCRFSSTVMVVKVPALRHMRDAEADDVLGRAAGERGAVEFDRAGRAHHVADRAQRGGLAGAVGAEQRGQASFIEGELKTVKRLNLTVIGPEIPDVEHRGHESLLPR